MALRSIELMIGDWIRIASDTYEKEYKGRAVQVAGLNDESGAIRVYLGDDPKYYDFWSDDEEDFEPIPLTEDILEENLAMCQHISWCVGWNKPTDIHIEIKTDDNAFYGVIAYVHQLQHALRLCGIDKEIIIK